MDMNRRWRVVVGAALGGCGLVLIGSGVPSLADNPFGGVRTPVRDVFRQMDEEWPTPTSMRTASGAPGHAYWQQRADYWIEVSLDEAAHRVTGAERVAYHNRSPDTLRYLWFQIDQNAFARDSEAMASARAPDLPRAEDGTISFDQLEQALGAARSECGYRIHAVTDTGGAALPYTIVGTMMRIDLPTPLRPGASVEVRMWWDYTVNESSKIGGRTGYEWFDEDKNAIYDIGDWYPRVAAYTDATGWENRQFLGKSEFALEFGDFEVKITVPAGHIVAATGVLQNPGEVLTEAQRDRLMEARTSELPVVVVTPEEAEANESNRAEGTRTWEFRAKHVRDFAWASSRKFAWDAWGRSQEGGGDVLCMSYFPKEAAATWTQFATQAIAQTIDVYGRHVLPYPYPVMSAVNGPVGGMEYPMLNFDGSRPEKDGTYSARGKYGLIGVIVHETGHNWFPMIISSDERRWGWMDEGFNTFVQFIATEAWGDEYPSRRGEPRDIVGYMRGGNQTPIMTNAESVVDLGNNQYAKTATGLNILRETILGRELFDFAFHEYARRWAFKHPEPADFFRTMEDASGVDLDWFWRGWFYTTDPVDIAIEGVRVYSMASNDPDIEKPAKKARKDAKETAEKSITEQRDDDAHKRVDDFPTLREFYSDYDELDVTEKDRKEFTEFLEGLEPNERALLEAKPILTVLDFRNVGGLVMPIILRVTWEGGEQEMVTIPVDIWRGSPDRVSKLVVSDKRVVSLEIDPFHQTPDIDESNNDWPPKAFEGWLTLTKDTKEPNPMQAAKKAAEEAEKAKAKDEPRDGAQE